MKFKMYAIEHVATKLLMPQLGKNRGYSHWNPNEDKKHNYKVLKMPRLFTSHSNAKRAITNWLRYPNATSEFICNVSYFGEPEEDTSFHIIHDNRTLADLRIVEITLSYKD
jgi:hypothetical protein